MAPVVLFPRRDVPRRLPHAGHAVRPQGLILAAAWAVLAAQVLGARLTRANPTMP